MPFTHIGTIYSPYKEKFTVPRQANLVPNLTAELHLLPQYGQNMVRGLDTFSHIWLIFLFHQTKNKGWRSTVRPPRLGGNRRIGTFASRSPFRPNNLGLSAVQLHGIRYQNAQVILELGSIDLIDGTPVMDIKPYLPYSDSYPYAKSSYAGRTEAPLSILFSEQARIALHQYQSDYPHLKQVITHILSQDPRPAYKKNHQDHKQYYSKLYDFTLCWQVTDALLIIQSIEKTA